MVDSSQSTGILSLLLMYVKKLADINPRIISQLTDSYVAKIKSLFGPSRSLTLGCKPNDCINLPQSARQISTTDNLLHDAKIKFREFRISQFQNDLNLAVRPSNPTHIIGQLVDILPRIKSYSPN